jgi:hypothetical protein
MQIVDGTNDGVVNQVAAAEHTTADWTFRQTLSARHTPIFRQV